MSKRTKKNPDSFRRSTRFYLEFNRIDWSRYDPRIGLKRCCSTHYQLTTPTWSLNVWPTTLKILPLEGTPPKLKLPKDWSCHDLLTAADAWFGPKDGELPWADANSKGHVKEHDEKTTEHNPVHAQRIRRFAADYNEINTSKRDERIALRKLSDTQYRLIAPTWIVDVWPATLTITTAMGSPPHFPLPKAWTLLQLLDAVDPWFRKNAPEQGAEGNGKKETKQKPPHGWEADRYVVVYLVGTGVRREMDVVATSLADALEMAQARYPSRVFSEVRRCDLRCLVSRCVTEQAVQHKENAHV
ncbi:MAG: hypothetical protein JW809_19500 [Pirellulales bacterium]|nr:hypothetical protein [Pirellulales bacterium]